MGGWLIERFPRGHFAPLFNLLDPVIMASDQRRKIRTPSSTADHYRVRGGNHVDLEGLGRSHGSPLHAAPVPTTAGATAPSPAAPPPASSGVAIDLDAAIKHLKDNAQPKSLGYCARYVRQAINAGGLILSSQPGSAKNYGTPLTAAGYTALPAANYVPAKGDVFVMQQTSVEQQHGHIAMFDGTIWISDFKQRDMWGGPTARKVKPAYVIYRP